jgi:hypothetical protein
MIVEKARSLLFCCNWERCFWDPKAGVSFNSATDGKRHTYYLPGMFPGELENPWRGSGGLVFALLIQLGANVSVSMFQWNLGIEGWKLTYQKVRKGRRTPK